MTINELLVVLEEALDTVIDAHENGEMTDLFTAAEDCHYALEKLYRFRSLNEEYK